MRQGRPLPAARRAVPSPPRPAQTGSGWRQIETVHAGGPAAQSSPRRHLDGLQWGARHARPAAQGRKERARGKREVVEAGDDGGTAKEMQGRAPVTPQRARRGRRLEEEDGDGRQGPHGGQLGPEVGGPPCARPRRRPSSPLLGVRKGLNRPRGEAEGSLEHAPKLGAPRHAPRELLQQPPPVLQEPAQLLQSEHLLRGGARPSAACTACRHARYSSRSRTMEGFAARTRSSCTSRSRARSSAAATAGPHPEPSGRAACRAARAVVSAVAVQSA